VAGRAAFDDVTASLVLHYLRDWGPALREFRRVLQPAGRLIISTHHPFMDHALAGGTDYFATYYPQATRKPMEGCRPRTA
jgi:ubiquinone/menaquinone biosynthesis C-methylase UbiE